MTPKSFSSPLARESSKKYNIDKVCADKAQDNRRNFNLLERLDVEPVIAIRNNASTRETSSKSRGLDQIKVGQQYRYSFPLGDTFHSIYK